MPERAWGFNSPLAHSKTEGPPDRGPFGLPVHEGLLVDGATADLTGEIEHRPYADVAEHLARMNHYTTLAAAQMNADGRDARAWHLVVHPPAAFVRNYVARGGLDASCRKNANRVGILPPGPFEARSFRSSLDR